jgi:hypothetical protein
MALRLANPPTFDNGKQVANVRAPDYGSLTPDVVKLVDGVVTGTALTSASAAFTPADVAKRVVIDADITDGASGKLKIKLSTTFAAYVDAHSMTLAAAPSSNIPSVAKVNYGTGVAAGLNALLASLSAAGGGAPFVPPGRWGSTRRTGVTLRLAPGAQLVWLGAQGGSFVSTDPTDPIQRAGLVGERAILDPSGACAVIFDLHSPQFCKFEGLEIEDGTLASTTIKLASDATNSSGYNAKRNAVGNVFDGIYQYGICGTFLSLDGVDANSVVTLNEFRNLHANKVRSRFLSFVDWCDSNSFSGMLRASLTANNAVGVVFNDSATPTANVGVYSIDIAKVSIDAFGGNDLYNGNAAYGGRVGMQVGNAKQISVGGYYQTPTAEGGDLVVDASAVSYDINMLGHVDGGANAHHRYVKKAYIEGDVNVGAGHLAPVGSAPTAAVAAGAGVGATISLSAGSSDSHGIITFTPNGTPTINSVQFTVTFAKAYANKPAVVMSEANATAAGKAVAARPFVDATNSSASQFSVMSGGTALAAGQALQYHYHVIGS